jgi:arylsulfatase A-like enzyme
LLLHGAGVQPGVRLQAGMPDIAPTLLHLMGEGVPAHMDGRVLTEALSPDLGPVRVAPAAASSAGPTSASSDEAAAIRERLERLGYL